MAAACTVAWEENVGEGLSTAGVGLTKEAPALGPQDRRRRGRNNLPPCQVRALSGAIMLACRRVVPHQQKWQKCRMFIVCDGKSVGVRVKLANGEVPFVTMANT